MGSPGGALLLPAPDERYRLKELTVTPELKIESRMVGMDEPFNQFRHRCLLKETAAVFNALVKPHHSPPPFRHSP